MPSESRGAPRHDRQSPFTDSLEKSFEIFSPSNLVLSHLPCARAPGERQRSPGPQQRGGVMGESVRLGVVGMGKMGLSHLSIVNPHPDVEVVGICDTTGYVLDVMQKYTGLRAFGDYRKMMDDAELDAVIVATPSRSHFDITRAALERGIHAFVEKPLALSVEEGEALVEQAEDAGIVNQVGYHYRFVGAFQEVKRLLDAGAIGEVHNYRVEAYGPVVLKPKGRTWRTRKTEGGGCLYDYASHAVNMLNWLFGVPTGTGGAIVNDVFSKDVDDEVYTTLYHPTGLGGQLCVNWSDETHRKMSLRVEIWGRKGRINADRQECQVYLRDEGNSELDLEQGWNVRYTTDLTRPVEFYVRGEEYSSQMEYFIAQVSSGGGDNVNSFSAALDTDRVLEAIRRDSDLGPRTLVAAPTASDADGGIRGWLSRRAPGRSGRGGE